MLPSAVLGYGLFPPEAFGVDAERLDTEPNIITHTIQDALRLLNRVGIPQPAEHQAAYVDYESAWAKVTLSLLIRHFAVSKASFSGTTRGPTGTAETPLGTLEEMLAAAADYYRQAQDIYPDAEWPSMNHRDASTFPLRRDTAGYYRLDKVKLER